MTEISSALIQMQLAGLIERYTYSTCDDDITLNPAKPGVKNSYSSHYYTERQFLELVNLTPEKAVKRMDTPLAKNLFILKWILEGKPNKELTL